MAAHPAHVAILRGSLRSHLRMRSECPSPFPPSPTPPCRVSSRCGLTRPWNDPAADIALARRGANATILIGRADGAIVASALIGHDGHRGWVYYVAVDP